MSASPIDFFSTLLDRILTKAYSEAKSETVVLTEFTGKQAGEYIHVLNSPSPFVCNLHGELDDASSWVLTASELRNLRDDPKYRTFVQSCLTAKTVVFLGVGADDIAVGGFLDHLSHIGVDFGPHYWITSRQDMQTDKWAEGRSVRLIRYEARGTDHSALVEMLDDLTGFVSKDDPTKIAPVVPQSCVAESEFPNVTPDLLLSKDAETIRRVLNKEANRILAPRDPNAYRAYELFSCEYDQAIYRAWYTSTAPGQNRLLGYTLRKEEASGAFGKVYRASDDLGQEVAVKVLHEQIRRNPDMLHSFRRGVNSMRILKNNNVVGMVPYRDAFEIPAFVVMDWVDGPDLSEAVTHRKIADWPMILAVGTAIADIVRRGHLLPERVLHRDLRPSNVMLKGLYTTPDNWEVVVLDFDLSWHRGAFEKSVVHGSTMLGYLAPEQIQPSSGVSTRHAAVDSFGLGMILFFMVSGRNPVPEEHRHASWNDTVETATKKWPCKNWCSIPRRFARLIMNATRDRQSDRWDMAQIQGELQRMHAVVSDPRSARSAELVAEEIAELCEFTSNYRWDASTFAAVKENPSGVKLLLRGDESQRKIRVEMSWGQPGVKGKRHLGKFIEPATSHVPYILQRFGWHVEEAGHRYASISVSASLSVDAALKDLDSTARCIDQAMEELRF